MSILITANKFHQMHVLDAANALHLLFNQYSLATKSV